MMRPSVAMLMIRSVRFEVGTPIYVIKIETPDRHDAVELSVLLRVYTLISSSISIDHRGRDFPAVLNPRIDVPYFTQHIQTPLSVQCTATVAISMEFSVSPISASRLEIRDLSVPLYRFLWSNRPHSVPFVAPWLGPWPWVHSLVSLPPRNTSSG